MACGQTEERMTFSTLLREAINRAGRHRQRWLQAHGQETTTAGISVGDYVLVRHGSADFA
eukprot:5709426-Pleurochrysis_carterae.AAC.6